MTFCFFGLGGTDRTSESRPASSLLRIVPDKVARRKAGLLGGFGGESGLLGFDFVCGGAEGRGVTRDTMAGPQLVLTLGIVSAYHGSDRRLC